MPNETNKIQLIIAFPRNKAKYSYYINNNLNDRYSMDRDEFYFFVASMLYPPHTVKARQMIDRNEYFLIDFENQDIIPLRQSQEDKEKRKKEMKKIKTEKIFKKWKREKEKNEQKKENSLYEKDIETLQKKALDKQNQNHYTEE